MRDLLVLLALTLLTASSSTTTTRALQVRVGGGGRGAVVVAPLVQQRQSSRLAPLEPDSGVLFGAWLDTTPTANGGQPSDTPVLFNRRLGLNASFFQMALDIPLNTSALPPINLLDATQTDAILYLTVYPRKLASFTPTGIEVFTQLTDRVLQQFAAQIQDWTKGGRRIFLRVAPEMNGGWNPYGQRPAHYIDFWRRLVTAIRTATAATPGAVSFIWSPNLGSGYPFPNGGFNPFTAQPYSATSSSNATEFALLDTNKDGTLDNKDDPYAPYWPGTEYVDWVGLSIYYYGLSYPWEVNSLPPAGFFQSAIEGTGTTSTSNPNGINFYQLYASPNAINGPKPMMISETAAGFHLNLVATPATPLAPGPGQLAIKQAYWRQFLANETFYASHPNLKAICLFEYIKNEESTRRDFQSSFDDVGAGLAADLAPLVSKGVVRTAKPVAPDAPIVTDPKGPAQGVVPGSSAAASTHSTVSKWSLLGMWTAAALILLVV
ncbi:glycoside hydrolase superfamily [Phlyctochytrium arcticum]|nr:glycoside hydrolase superfamily [Phlyctochytrium arcticum]